MAAGLKKGHGVDPDIIVNEDLSAMTKGIDPQLERAVTEIKKKLKEKPIRCPQHHPMKNVIN